MFATFFVPCICIMIIISSYIGIWNKVRRSTKYFQTLGVNPITPSPVLHTKQLSKRDIKMTKTILILIITNLLFWLPYGLLVNIALDLTVKPSPYTKEQYIVTVVLVAIFESQYAINFFIYMARHEQYRNAFFGVTRESRRRTRSPNAKPSRSWMRTLKGLRGNSVIPLHCFQLIEMTLFSSPPASSVHRTDVVSVLVIFYSNNFVWL